MALIKRQLHVGPWGAHSGPLGLACSRSHLRNKGKRSAELCGAPQRTAGGSFLLLPPPVAAPTAAQAHPPALALSIKRRTTLLLCGSSAVDSHTIAFAPAGKPAAQQAAGSLQAAAGEEAPWDPPPDPMQAAWQHINNTLEVRKGRCQRAACSSGGAAVSPWLPTPTHCILAPLQASPGTPVPCDPALLDTFAAAPWLLPPNCTALPYQGG